MGGKWGHIGIAKVKILTSSRHIHAQNFLKNPRMEITTQLKNFVGTFENFV